MARKGSSNDRERLTRAGWVALIATLVGSCSQPAPVEEQVRIVQPPSPATGAIYLQVIAAKPERPPPVIEMSLDGTNWSRPKTPIMMPRPDEYALLLDVRRVGAPVVYFRAYPKGGSNSSARSVQVQLNHPPNVSAKYGFSRADAAYVLDATGSTDPDAGDSVTKVLWKFDDGTTLEGPRVTKPVRAESGPLPGYVQVFDARGGVGELHFVLAAASALLADGALAAVPPAEKCECISGSLKFVTAGDSTLNPGRPLGPEYKVGDSFPLDADGFTSKTVYLHAAFEVTAQVRYVEGEKKSCPEMQVAMRTLQNSTTSFFRVLDGDVALPYPFVDTPQARDFGLDGYQHEYRSRAGKRADAAPHKLTGGDGDADAVEVIAKRYDGNKITWYDEPGVDIAAGASPLVTGYSYKARFKAIVESCVKTMKIEWDVDRYGEVKTQTMMEE